MAGSATNIINSPVNVYWRAEAIEVFDVSKVTSFDGTEFNLYKVDGTKGRVVFDLDNLSTVPAAGAGEIVYEVDVTTGDSASVVAAALQAVLDLDADLTATVSGTKVTVTRVAVGKVTSPADVDSGVGIQICRTGQDLDLGLLQGAISFSASPSNFPVTSHQTGLSTISSLHQGFEEVSASTTLQETNKSKLEELYTIYGDKWTPAGGTEVFGLGSVAVGRNMLTYAARLEMIPVNYINDELSYNVAMVLALPSPGTLTFSGEEPRILEVEWTGFVDTLKDSRTDIVIVGDASQAGL